MKNNHLSSTVDLSTCLAVHYTQKGYLAPGSPLIQTMSNINVFIIMCNIVDVDPLPILTGRFGGSWRKLKVKKGTCPMENEMRFFRRAEESGPCVSFTPSPFKGVGPSFTNRHSPFYAKVISNPVPPVIKCK